MPRRPTPEQMKRAEAAAAAVLDVDVEAVKVILLRQKGRPQADFTDDEIKAAYAQHGNYRAAANALSASGRKISATTVYNYLSRPAPRTSKKKRPVVQK